MISAIRHIGIVVADLEKSLQFWCNALGFEVYRRMDESGPHIDSMMGLTGVRVTTVKLAAPDGNLIELLYFHSHPDLPNWRGSPFSTGLTHLSMTVDCMEQAVTQLGRCGVLFPNPPQRSLDGKVIVTYAVGPEKVLLELVEELA